MRCYSRTMASDDVPSDVEQLDSDAFLEQVCRCAQLQVDEVRYAQQVNGSLVLSDRRTLVDLEAAAQGLDGLSAAGRRRASETLLQPSFMPPIALQLPLPDASGKDGRLRLQMELPRGYPLLVPPAERGSPHGHTAALCCTGQSST